MATPSSFCLDCRTALHNDDVCDGGDDHRVVSLARSGAHEALVTVTWGNAQSRELDQQRRRQLERAWDLGALGVFFATMLVAWLLTGVSFWFLAAPFAALVAMAVVYSRLGGEGRKQLPIGGVALLGDGSLYGRGEIDGEPTLRSPATGTACLAYALELHLEGSGEARAMYRDAVTCGFDIQLEDGSLARVPRGRIRFAGPMRQAIDVDNRELDSYLAELDERRAPDSDYDPFRYNVVYEAVLLPGDRIELLSPFEPRLSAAAPTTLYRNSMPSVLVPRTIPRIRQLTSTV